MRLPGIFAAICICVTAGIAQAETYTQIKLDKLTKQQYLQIQQMGLDRLESEGDVIEILAKSADLIWLQESGIGYEVVIPDVVQFYQDRIGADKTMGGFRTFSEIVAYLDSLHLAYPTLTTAKFSIGSSLQGNPIWAMKISDNPNVDENETEMLYISVIHAREPAAAAAVLHLMNHFLSNYGSNSEITDIVNNRELYFIPIQNPDGYLFNQSTNPGGGGLWRKNRKNNGDGTFGVDLNRNYGADWGFDDVGSSPQTNSETYRGPSAFSELETQAVRDFTISRNFTIVHNYHCYSNLVLWPPGNVRDYTSQEDFFRNLGDSMTQFNNYTPQPGWALYPTNGAADDWHWGDTILKPRQISITTEIGNSGDGFWPSPARIPTLVAENVYPGVFLARIAANPYIIGPPVTPVLSAPDSSGNNFSISWTSTDTINPPVSYRVVEMTGKATVTDGAETDAGYWDQVRMAISNTRAHTGASSWSAQSTNQANHWLISRIPYEVKTNDSLVFWMWYDIEEDFDYFYAQVSTDGGFSFTSLANNLTTNNDPNNVNLGNGITGSSSNIWRRAAFNLAPYVGQQIVVRLAYFTDGFVLGNGVFIDDIEKVEFFADTTEISPAALGFTYNFVSEPNGNYWYRITGTDAQGQESRFSNIEGIKVQGLLIGDCNSSGTLNVLDLNFLVAYLFSGGPAPNPLALGDLNCSGGINVLDLNRFVAFIFGGASAPSCP